MLLTFCTLILFILFFLWSDMILESLLVQEYIARYKDNRLPAIIIIPGIGGSMGIGMNEVRESAKRAIGADILFSE